MSTEQLLEQISSKLDLILGMMVIAANDDEATRVFRLRDLGFDNRTIASLTGLTPNAVKLRLRRAKRTA
jgi:DNA-directed RNA polymerase specialized sigma24 family protein